MFVAEILADLAEHAEVHHARQVQRLEHVVTESLGAWERSKQERTQRRHRRLNAPATPSAGPATLSEAVVTSRDGDPRYLRQALMALADLRRVTEPVETRESSSGPAGVRPTRWDLSKLTNEELRQMQRMAKKACPTTPPADER